MVVGEQRYGRAGGSAASIGDDAREQTMKKGLASWFAIWHPRYRLILDQLLLAGTLAFGVVYLQNIFLRLLTESLSSTRISGIPQVLSSISTSLHIGPSLLFLSLFILAGLAAAATEFWNVRASGKLAMRSKDDTETEVLVHLLRKDDTFFSRHSPAETVNRLAMDLYRVSDRRPNLMNVWRSSLLIIANLVFFLPVDWRLAIVPLAACVAGALWTRCMTRNVKEMDSDYMRQDDCVKSRFEDFLRAAPEVQVGRLYGKIRRDIGELQRDRSNTYRRYVRLRAVLGVGNTTSYLMAFVAMIIVVLHLRSAGTEYGALVALIPVVVMRLPQLFQNASQLVFLNLQFQLARTSMDRLLEYEAHETPQVEPAGSGKGRPVFVPEGGQARPDTTIAPSSELTQEAELFRLENVTYRYTSPDGTMQGGVTEVSTAFTSGQWTAIVGGAGSGKSTLLKLLLGRLKPQSGEVLYGEMALDALPGDRAASLFSIMPQSLALLDMTLLHNLLFGRPVSGDTRASTPRLSDADLDVVERAGLGKVCRLKALELTPEESADSRAIFGAVIGARGRLRERLREECDADVLPYEAGHPDPKHWVLECLTGGRCDRDRSVRLLLGRTGRRVLERLLRAKLGPDLVELGRAVLRETHHLLRIPNFNVYCQLAPFPLDERLWKLRSSCVDLGEASSLSPKERLSLCQIALTSSPAELATSELSDKRRRQELRDDFSLKIGELGGLLGDACVPFAAEEIHPYLTWRENLVFGVVDIRNSRTGRIVEDAVLEFLEQQGLKDAFTRLGLEFGIGRLGGNLSGGQGQLVGLCRALLRRTPVLLLDEPTSALDPASRARIAEFLRAWKRSRIVITVSHDVEFIRESDEVKLMDGGRLAASGTFSQLKEGSEVFRRALKQT